MILSIIVKYLKLWFQAYVSGILTSLFNIIGIGLRKISPRFIVEVHNNPLFKHE
jgi:uncharacterized protein YqfA (UPF0365 family)